MIEAFAFLAIGTVWFVVACVVLFFLVLFLSENERNFAAFFCIAAFITLMHLAGNIDIFADPLQLLMYVGIYFVVGTPWSFIKWFSLLNQKKDDLMEIKARWCDGNAVALKSPVPPAEWDGFAEAVKESNYHPNQSHGGYGWKPQSSEDLIPDWSKYKRKLTGWIIFWPTSAFWTILNDPLVRLGNWIRDRFRAVYRGIANHVFRKFQV